MTYDELLKAKQFTRRIEDAGFIIHPITGSERIGISAKHNHEKHNAFGFVHNNSLHSFETLEEVDAFIIGWETCKSMMKLSGQTK